VTGLQEELASLLASPSESITVDFKERLSWQDLRGKLDMIKDIVALANRNGGLLVIGLRDEGGGVFTRLGLGEDKLPDPTVVGVFGRKYFEPFPTFTITPVAVDGLVYGVVSVDEFARVPFVCRATGNDEGGKLVLRRGAIYRRSDALESKEIDTGTEIAELIQTAVTKSGLATARTGALGAVDATVERAATGEPLYEQPVLLCDLAVTPPAARELISKTLARISRSTVDGGALIVPRGIRIEQLEPSAIVREVGRVSIERPEEGRQPSLIEVSWDLSVKLRDGLPQEPKQLDYSWLTAYVLGCIVFARDFYDDQPDSRLTIRLGAAGVAGYALSLDPRYFSVFFHSYVATTMKPLTAERQVSPAELRDTSTVVELAHSVMVELSEYFGLRLQPAAFEAQMNHVARQVGDLRAFTVGEGMKHPRPAE
jgi:Schlafen, AlbA_2